MSMAAETNIVSIGAGRMGRGIAVTFAMAGYPVTVIDMKKRSAAEYDALKQQAHTEIASTFTMLVNVGLIDDSQAGKALTRVTFTSEAQSLSPLKCADVIFEGVTETIDAKRDVFSRIGAHIRPDCILASTTSTILSDELANFVEYPERFLNAHWLNPAFLVPLVELSPSKQTSPDITETLKQRLESIGKVPVVCASSPGYIVPRIQALAMNEAARMIEEGVATADDIDKATKYGFGFRFATLGLLEFIDWGGGDILYHASRYMTAVTGEDRFASPAIIESNMKEGKIGLQAKRGFLDYSNMDVDAYRLGKIREFVAMLEHLEKLPERAR